MEQTEAKRKEQQIQALIEKIAAEPPEYAFVCGGPMVLFQYEDMSDAEYSALQRICDAKGRKPTWDERQRVRALLQS